ncbi:MAG TPA: hypothetical protein PK808_06120, partial [Polymorphobacter sp.]|nr:hypothetical protein [Polymorphobacter sp.]
MSNLPAIVDAQLEGATDIGRTWTETMLEMAEWIGTDATRKLIDHFGGTEIYVPMTMPGNHPIVDAIGFDAAQKLAEIYGRERKDLGAVECRQCAARSRQFNAFT